MHGEDGGQLTLKPAGWVLIAAAMVFAGLWLAGLLAPVPAIAGFAVMAIAAVIARTVHDPPEIARSLRQLPAAEELPIEAVLAGLPDAVIAVDPAGEVVALNGPARAIAPALRLGEPLSRGLRVPEILDAIRRARAAGAPQSVEFRERVPVERHFEAVAAPIPSATRPDLMLVAFRDLTPLRRTEEMRADFIANASHELRTPLAALSGFIETLQGPAREDPESRDRFLTIMQAQANRMARLIDDLLSLSRIELNEHLRPNKQVDIADILRQVADTLETLARDRGVQIEIAGGSSTLFVLGDRDELTRVFENLLENALKYAASGKKVEIGVSLSDESGGPEARIAVRDYGPGIAPEHLPRLTERFYRVDIVESRAQGGTGLGLALVKHILNRHGGRLAIESEPGHGATFTVLLPVAPKF